MSYSHRPHTHYSFDAEDTHCAVCGVYFETAPLSDLTTTPPVDAPSDVVSEVVDYPAGTTYANGPLSRFRSDFPALTGDMVLQGHADACDLYGHAFYRVDGIDQGYCPRCYAVTGTPAPAPENAVNENAPTPTHIELDSDPDVFSAHYTNPDSRIPEWLTVVFPIGQLVTFTATLGNQTEPRAVTGYMEYADGTFALKVIENESAWYNTVDPADATPYYPEATARLDAEAIEAVIAEGDALMSSGEFNALSPMFKPLLDSFENGRLSAYWGSVQREIESDWFMPAARFARNVSTRVTGFDTTPDFAF